MKNFKVNLYHVENSVFYSSLYFDTMKEATDALLKYNKNAHCLTAKYVGAVEVMPHHTAIARGYEPVKSERTECYSGKFGTGYIKHYPTKGSDVRSAWFHRIEYFIEK